MFEQISSIVSRLRDAVSSFDPSTLGGTDAARLVDLFAEAERLAVAGRTLAVGRVATTRAWADSGHRTAAVWLASRTKSGLRDAICTLGTAHNLRVLPATREQFVSGALSGIQAAEISAAAAVDPSAEASLLQMATTETIGSLRERCREVTAAVAGDEDACERIRRGRYLRNWCDRDGAVRLDARLAPDDGALLLAVVSASAERLRSEARRSGQREPAAAYAADALVHLASGSGSVRAVVHVDVSQPALERGHTIAGEVSRIRGVGPVPVGVAARLAASGSVNVIERVGVDVKRVGHMGRSIPAYLRTALQARDPVCVVPGCEVASTLEIDHITPFADGGPTRLENLARLCRFHHGAKTHHGWRLGGEPGSWTWEKRGNIARQPPARAP